MSNATPAHRHRPRPRHQLGLGLGRRGLVARGAVLASLIVAFCAAPAAAQRVIAVAPLATMGSEDTSASAQATAASLEKAIAALPATKVIGAAQVAQAIKRARRPALAACDGEPACIAELGQLAGATVLITGQSGGLGEARVLYLRAVAAASGQELGSTTWTAGAGDSAGAAVARLLAPATYVGRLTLAIVPPTPPSPSSPSGAAASGPAAKDITLYVNGSRFGTAATPSYSLPVGTHALRITHPEHRDFVRFVDIGYGATTEVAVALQPLPVVQSDMEQRRGGSSSGGAGRSWARRWWVVAGGAAVIGVVAGVIAYSLADDFDPDVTYP